MRLRARSKSQGELLRFWLRQNDVLLGMTVDSGEGQMRKFFWTLLVGVCVVAGAQAPAVKVEATPAMWKVKGVHGTVYLFGSVHVMKPEVQWETAKVKAALAESDLLYLEIPDVDPEAMKALQPLALQMGMDMEHPLSTKISKDDVALLDTAVKGLGMPGESSFEPLRPWMVYTILSVLPATKAGYATDSGIDAKMAAEAKAQKKPIKGFETAEAQLHFLADMPESQQIEMLHKALIDLPKSQAQLDDMVGDWTRGDVDKIAAMENDEMKVKYPDLYEKLLVQRNKHFAEVLTGMLKDPSTGTVFVTIGAAHLAGPDGVGKMLEKNGYTVARVE